MPCSLHHFKTETNCAHCQLGAQTTPLRQVRYTPPGAPKKPFNPGLLALQPNNPHVHRQLFPPYLYQHPPGTP